MNGFDAEKFISEIESRAEIWNTECREYANNNEKAKVCEEVYVIFYENFLGKEGAEKNELNKYCSLFECILNMHLILRAQLHFGRKNIINVTINLSR
jgi:hypothetical protein